MCRVRACALVGRETDLQSLLSRACSQESDPFGKHGSGWGWMGGGREDSVDFQNSHTHRFTPLVSGVPIRGRLNSFLAKKVAFVVRDEVYITNILQEMLVR